MYADGYGGVPQELAGFTQLTAVELESFRARYYHHDANFGPLRHLPSLQVLTLRYCGLRGVPEVITGLTSLTHFAVEETRQGTGATLAGGLERLAALPDLRSLVLTSCNLTKLPRMLSTFSTLTCLDLSNNPGLVLTDGWRRFAPLPCLRSSACPTPICIRWFLSWLPCTIEVP